MSYIAKDGASISATEVTRIDCSKCGQVLLSRWPMNDREAEDALREHVRSHDKRHAERHA
jgi:hypothetical protein